MKRWSLNFDACVECGCTDSTHRARGVCQRCVQRAKRGTVPEKAHRRHQVLNMAVRDLLRHIGDESGHEENLAHLTPETLSRVELKKR